jgi:hypothetical protein
MNAAVDHLPDVATILTPLLARVAPERQPLLIAIAERHAAQRYRAWATEPALAGHAERLRACAEREEEIARRVEALHPDAAAVQAALQAELPELDDVERTLFTGRPLRDQLTIQSRGERLGAATWRALAQRTADATARDVLSSCAPLEEASALVLDDVLATALS